MKRTTQIVFGLIFIGLLVSNAILSIVPWLFLVYSAWLNYRIHGKIKISFERFYLGYFLYFLLLLFGLAWSDNMIRGSELVLRKIYFITVPLTFLFLGSSTRKIDVEQILKIFIYVLSAYCIFALGQVFWYLSQNEMPLEYAVTKIIRSRFQEVISFPVHHAYLGLYINIALFALVDLSFKLRYKLLFSLIFLWVLYVNSSLSAFIGIGFVGIYAFYFKLFSGLNRRYKLSLVVVSIMAIVSLAYLFKDRYYNVGYWESPTYRVLRVFKEGDPSRIVNWKSSIEVFRENLFFGTGTGDDIDELQKKRDKSHYVYKDKLNQHNQFLAEGTRLGLLGLVVFCFMLIFVALGIKDKHLGIVFIVLIILGFLTENILDRQKGIVFFLFFSLLLNLKGHQPRMSSIDGDIK